MEVFLTCRDHSNFVNCVRYSPDGTKFITVSSDRKGIIYDGKSGDKLGELSAEGGHKGSIYAVSWSPDSKQVIIRNKNKQEFVTTYCNLKMSSLKELIHLNCKFFI